MKVDLFIKTYKKDFKWLEYCFRSIKKFAKNYNELIIVVPLDEQEEFDLAAFDFPERTRVEFIKEEGNGYLWQQYIKMIAHTFSDADYIKYLDSDCIFTKEFDAHSLIYDGRPEILYRYYLDKDGKNQVDGASCWQEPTSKFLNQYIDKEFMCRHIFCYHRSTLENIEKWCIKTHNKTLKSYIMNSGSFSEFNTIGAWCHLYEQHNYNFVDTNNGWIYVEPQVHQFWSYSGLTEEEKNKIEIILN